MITFIGGVHQTPDCYKGFAIGLFTKFLDSSILYLLEGLGNCTLPRRLMVFRTFARFC